MRGFRVRWAGAAKLAAITIVAVIALQALPHLLRAPEPPPLAKDVGLPRVVPRPPGLESALPEPQPPKLRFQMHPRGEKGTTGSAAADVIGSRPRHRRDRSRRARSKHRGKSAAAATAPPVAPVPPPAPAPPAPAPVSAPSAPSPPGDGSEEFAPH